MKLWKSIALLALIALAYNALYFNRDIQLTDEGVEVYTAYRVFKGEVPYRDFVTLYTPGAYFLNALLFSMFVPQLLVGRVAMLLTSCVLTVIVYLMARQLMPPRWAFLSGMVIVFWGTSHCPPPIASWYALLWSTLSIACLTAFLRTRKPIWIVGAGVLAGLSVLFKQNFGVLTILSSLLFMFCMPLLHSFSSAVRTHIRWPKEWNWVIVYLVSLLAPVFLLLCYLFVNSALRHFWSDTILFLSRYPNRQLLPGLLTLWSSLPKNILAFRQWVVFFNLMLLYLPLLIGIGSGVLVVHKWRTRYKFPHTVGRGEPYLLLYTLYCLFLYLQIYPVADFTHLVWVLPPVVLLGTYLVYEAQRWLRRRMCNRKLTHVVGFCRIVVCVLPLLFAFYGLIQGLRFLLTADLRFHHNTEVNLERASGILMSENSAVELTLLVKYVDAVVPPDDPIFVLTNQPIVYFLADRRNPTPHSQLVFFIPDEQPEQISALERADVAWVIGRYDEYWTAFWRRQFPILFQYVDEHFSLDRQIGRWSVYHRNNSGDTRQ